MAKRYLRHRAFYIGLAVGVVAGLAALPLFPKLAIEIGAVAFFAAYLVLSLVHLPVLTTAHLRAHADEDDAPVAWIFLATFGIVVVAVVSLFQIINAKAAPGLLQLVLNVVAVALGWFVVHTMAAYHYAFEFYETDGKGSAPLGGLDFPGKAQPDGLSFLYFSYVIGMTAQVADVATTDNRMRRLVLIHGIFAFFFNTVIVAATVNVVVSLGH